jgi:hypothetical protein
MRRVAHRDAPLRPEQRQQVGARRERDRVRRVGRRDQHQRIAKRAEARGGHDEVALLDIVHPGLVGGQEEIRRRTLLDLPGERGGGGEGEARRGVAARRPLRAEIPQRVLQRGRGEDRHLCGLRAGRQGRGGGKQAEQEGSARVAHAGPPGEAVIIHD